MNPGDHNVTIGATDVGTLVDPYGAESLNRLWTRKCNTGPKIWNDNSSFATRWGHRYEPVSRTIYEMLNGVSVELCGKKSHKDYPWLRAIPDGITNDRLIEIKNVVSRKIGVIPKKYFAQMQITMAVYNVDKCDYFDTQFYQYQDESHFYNDTAKDIIDINDIIVNNRSLQSLINDGYFVKGVSHDDNGVPFYWKLLQYKQVLIHRDSDWFKENMKRVIETRNRMIFAKRIGLDEFNRYYNGVTDLKSWISVSKLFNFSNGDTILDWLNVYGVQNGYTPDNLQETYDPYMDFNRFITDKSTAFKEKVIDSLKDRFTTIQIVEHPFPYITNLVNAMYDTYCAMIDGIEVIIRPVLCIPKDKTYVLLDLLVRLDIVDRLTTDDNVYIEKMEKFTVPKGQYGYRAVQIRFGAIQLTSNGKFIRNSDTFKMQKLKVCYANRALKELTGQEIHTGFIIGRKYNYVSKGIKKYGRSAFDRLGSMDFSTWDLQYIDQLNRGFSWYKELLNCGDKWTPIDANGLPSRPELYCNMKNTYNGNWGRAKSAIAKRIGEITMLYYASPKNRRIAHNNGVYSLNDPYCNTQTLGMNNRKNAFIIDRIIDVNRDTSDEVVMPKMIKNNHGEWKKRSALELYIDFESTNDLNDDFSRFPRAASVQSSGMVFLIGIGHINEKSEWEFKHFIVDKLVSHDEKKIMISCIKYIIELCKRYNTDSPKIFHYAGPEVYMTERIIKSNFKNCPIQFNWCDLYKVITLEPVTFKGAYNFTLKSVTGALYKHGLIGTVWKNMSKCTNGISAMTVAFNCKNNESSFERNIKMKDVIVYNECDCKVMWEILVYLRENHVYQDVQSMRGKKRKRIDLEEDLYFNEDQDEDLDEDLDEDPEHSGDSEDTVIIDFDEPPITPIGDRSTNVFVHIKKKHKKNE